MNKPICAVTVLALSTTHADTIFVDADACPGALVALVPHFQIEKLEVLPGWITTSPIDARFSSAYTWLLLRT